MAAQWTSVICLARFNALAGRSSTGDSITDAEKYERLSDAQSVVIADAASRVPKAFYPTGALPTMTTVDNNVFTFGTDANGDALFPLGKVRIFPHLSAVPDSPWVEGIDYLAEGTQIRIPSNRSYGGTLYWRGITPPEALSASVNPVIDPPSARVLLVYEAVRRYAEEGGRDTKLADRMAMNYARDFARWCLSLRTQMSSGGMGGPLTGLRRAMIG